MEENEMENGGQATVEGEDELALVREVVLRAHPDVVPELVSGGTIAELLASVEPARAAFARVREQVRPAAGTSVATEPAPPAVPAGSATAVVDPATLPASELIRRGVAAARR